MRVASLAIGIGAYSDPRLESGHSRLHFAAHDAHAFHSYAAKAWSGDQDLHLSPLVDQEADRNGLEQAINKVAAAGPLDLFLFYLSGHGETLAQKGWFCLSDAKNGEPSLTTSEIDRLLATIDTSQVLLIADYCYAEASLAGSRYFATLEGNSARIYIASARRDQRAWEDIELKRSILSDVLLKAVASGSPLAGWDGTVEVETKLIPHLRAQVPLEAAARKRGVVQEPVAGGTATGAIRLPTIAGRNMRRPLSISDTLRMRLRRILAFGAISVLAIWAVVDTLVYHLAVGPNGTILVRPGPAALYGLTPYHFRSEVDTGFSIEDLSHRDQDALRRLSRGSVFGLATRTDRDGLRLWLAQLEPALSYSSAARARMLARANRPQFDSDHPPPLWETGFVAYASGIEARRIADEIYPALPPISTDCGRAVSEQFDFGLLNVPPDTFARDIAWRAFRIEGYRHQDEIVQLVTAVAYRVAHAEEAAQIGKDLEALADAATLTNSASWPDLPSLNGWCESVPAALVRTLTGDDQIRFDAEAKLVAGLPTQRLQPGKDLTHPQAASIYALTLLASRGNMQGETIEEIVASFDRSGESLGIDTALNRLLLETAAHHPLPQLFRSRLFDVLGREGDAVDFEALVAFRLLARNVVYLTETEQGTLRDWLDRNGEANYTVSMLHEGLGNLALVLPLRPEEVAWLVSRLSPYSWLPPQPLTNRGETIIHASDEEAAVALARIHRHHSLDQEVIDRLLTIAAHRTGLRDRSAMLRGLALGPDYIDRKIVERLSGHKTSLVMRQLYIDIASAQLSETPPDKRERILLNLYKSWQKSRAPELRLALGEIIGRVVVGNVPTRGSVQAFP